MPPWIQALYQRPDKDWSADDWRTLALYLADELNAAWAAQSDAVDAAQRANDTAAAAVLRVQRYRLAMARVNSSFEKGLLRLGKPRGRPGRPIKPADEIDLETRELVELVSGLGGSTKAAQFKARAQLESIGARLPHHRSLFDRYLKTWRNKISMARRLEAEQRLMKMHGLSLAYVAALNAEGFGRKRRRRKIPKNP